MSLATLIEFAARSHDSDFFDDAGPANIAYWSWSKAQVVIIDDIGPLLAPTARNYDDQVDHLRQVLNDQLNPIRKALARCHTVWVIGDQALDQFADEIRTFCTSPGEPRPDVLVAQIDHGAPERTPRTPRVRTRHLA